MVAPAVIAGIGALAASAVNLMTGTKQLEQQESQYNQSRADLGMAHQREMADLKAAGLNPILTGLGGSGLGAPSAGSASGIALQNPMAEVASLSQEQERVSSAAELNRAQADRAEQDSINLQMDTELKRAQIPKMAADTVSSAESAKTQMKQQRLLDAQRRRTDAETEGQKILNLISSDNRKGTRIEGEIDERPEGGMSRLIRRYLPFINSGTSLSRSFGR